MLLPPLDQQSDIAVALSGGPDSMALCHMLAQQELDVRIHALTVDHGLRPESAAEAMQVGRWIVDWPHVTHHICTWDAPKPETRILEEARAARYRLMADYCQAHGIKHLYLAHHQDDQAETFLIRLCKGSGLDGLGGMQDKQDWQEGVTLVRPLLDVSKQDLIDYCADNAISYVQDPTNENPDYLRPRLRQAKAVLENEGLSAKRLSTTAKRLRRARQALEQVADGIWKQAVVDNAVDKGGALRIDFAFLRVQPEEIVLRVLLRAINGLRADASYAPRMEKAEDLCDRLLTDRSFKRATLGGCLIELNGQILTILKEK